MHEQHFTSQIVDAILIELQRHAGVKPSKVRVKVGEMFHLVPDSVTTHFAVLVKGTVLEGAELELVETPVSVRCRICGHEGGVQDHHFLMCSVCSSTDVEMLTGNDVEIEPIEV